MAPLNTIIPNNMAPLNTIIPTNMAPLNIRLPYKPHYSSLSEHMNALQDAEKSKIKYARVGGRES